MMKHFVTLFSFVFLVHVLVTAQNSSIYTSGKSEVSFVSDAPLELIKASSDKLKGLLNTDKRTFAFTIPNDSFKGFNSALQQEHFYENYMEARQFPVSKFEGKIIEQTDITIPGNYTIRAKGKLTIHGVEQERIIKVNIRTANGLVNADAAFTILLADHNINIPRVVYHKIAEEIKVKVSIEFKPQK